MLIIEGEFYSVNSVRYKITIKNHLLGGSKTLTYKIPFSGNLKPLFGVDNNFKIWLADDPVHIERTWDDDLLSLILKTSCEINLVVRGYVYQLFFAKNIGDIEITIDSFNNCIFDGYVIPLTLKLNYAYDLEDFTLNCIDKLSALKYFNYNNCNSQAEWVIGKSDGDIKSFGDIIKSMIINDGNIECYCNSTMRVTGSSKNIFDAIGVNEVIFYGEEYDDLMTLEDALQELLKYTNLKAIQIGKTIHIFDLFTDDLSNYQKYRVF